MRCELLRLQLSVLFICCCSLANTGSSLLAPGSCPREACSSSLRSLPGVCVCGGGTWDLSGCVVVVFVFVCFGCGQFCSYFMFKLECLLLRVLVLESWSLWGFQERSGPFPWMTHVHTQSCTVSVPPWPGWESLAKGVSPLRLRPSFISALP